MRRRRDAAIRHVRYEFTTCRATMAARYPGTREWRHRFWLRTGVTVGGELGMTVCGALAIGYLTGAAPVAWRLITDGLVYLLLSAQLVWALRQVQEEMHSLRRAVARYTDHKAYVDARILADTIAALALQSIPAQKLAEAGVVPSAGATGLRDPAAPRTPRR